tara:strand:+ start:274 stop:789 length:516 start_codon:yes stop_codon:yes gene_type:complete
MNFNQKYTSAITSINSIKTPIVFKKALSNNLLFGSESLDIGGGRYETLTKSLSDIGINNNIYDPYNRTPLQNESALRKCGEYDIAIISNVLNVICESSIRHWLVSLACNSLRDGGILLITVYEGNKSGIGKASKKDCWQENRKTIDYVNDVKCHFKNVNIKNGLIYAYKGN